MKYRAIVAPASKFDYTHNRIISVRPRENRKLMSIQERRKNVPEHIQLERAQRAEAKRARRAVR